MYQSFIGIDMGKATFVAAQHGKKNTHSFPNTEAGFEAFLNSDDFILDHALVVVETTGGYEKAFIRYLALRTVAIHRCDGRMPNSLFEITQQAVLPTVMQVLAGG